MIAGADIGFIMVPGAQIPGEKYIPLAEEIQRQMSDKARVWVGVTKSWLGNFPNPIEIAGALNDCMSQVISVLFNFKHSYHHKSCSRPQQRGMVAKSTLQDTVLVESCWRPILR